MDIKLYLLKSCVWRVRLCRSGCRASSNGVVKTLEAMEMKCLRKMVRICWADKKTNIVILTAAGVTRSFIETTKKGQMKSNCAMVSTNYGTKFLW